MTQGSRVLAIISAGWDEDHRLGCHKIIMDCRCCVQECPCLRLRDCVVGGWVVSRGSKSVDVMLKMWEGTAREVAAAYMSAIGDSAVPGMLIQQRTLRSASVAAVQDHSQQTLYSGWPCR